MIQLNMKDLNKTLSIFLVFLFISCGGQKKKQGSNSEVTVFINARVLTVDSIFSETEAFAISKNIIIAVGDKKDVLKNAGENPKIIDLKYQTVMPAFIDAHIHTIGAAQFSVFDDVGLLKYKTVESALEYMIEQGKKSKNGDWLLFANIDFGTQATELEKLTADVLNQVSSEIPVFVLHAGGHISSVNSKMIELMGLNKDSPEPESGGKIGRLESGEPNGLLYGIASLSALKIIEPWAKFNLDEGIESSSLNWLSTGLGTLGDAGIGNTGNAEEFDQLSNYANNGDLKLRIRAYLHYTQEAEWEKRKLTVNSGNDKVRVVGYKLAADGSNQARTGLQREAYLGTETKGLAYMSEEELYKQILDKSNKGFQLAIHGNGDAGIDNILSALTSANDNGAELIRPRIEHCSFVQDDQLDKFKSLGVSASFLIGHVSLWGAAYKNSIFDLEKAEKLDRTGTFERESIPYSLHSDAAVTTFTPLEMVEIAVSRKLYSEPDFILAPSEKATRKMAIRGITSTAAWQLMSEKEIGSIEVGKFADFVILEQNPMTVPEEKIGEIRVLQTWINGQKVFELK